MNNEYKITTKTYKEPQQLKNWEDRIVYKSCKTYSKKDYKKTEFYLDDDFKILHCVIEEKTSKKPYLKETRVSFLSEEWAKKQEENSIEHRYYSVKITIDEKFETYFLYRDKNFEIPMQKGVCPKKGVKYTEEDKLMLGDINYDMEGNPILPTELDDETKALIDYIQAEQINKQKKYESITKKGLELFNKNQPAKFIELYNNEISSIDERIEALGVLLSEILEKENWDWKKVLKFRKSIIKSKNNDFIYLFNDAIFQSGAISPEEFVQSIEDGIKKQIPMAYAIKSNFYKYGLEVLEPCLEAIKKAIMLEPNNLEYKKMLNELEQEKAINNEQDM